VGFNTNKLTASKTSHILRTNKIIPNMPDINVSGLMLTAPSNNPSKDFKRGKQRRINDQRVMVNMNTIGIIVYSAFLPVLSNQTETARSVRLASS
jgi:hypothetical protein